MRILQNYNLFLKYGCRIKQFLLGFFSNMVSTTSRKYFLKLVINIKSYFIFVSNSFFTKYSIQNIYKID